jgi:hypothetical protein
MSMPGELLMMSKEMQALQRPIVLLVTVFQISLAVLQIILDIFFQKHLWLTQIV